MLSRIQKDLFDNTTSPVIKYRLALLLNEDISQECFDNFYTSKWVQMQKTTRTLMEDMDVFILKIQK